MDDVVLGCAALVVAHPGAAVVTLTAGRPGTHALTDWDRRCGFAEGDDVVGARRREDSAALRLLGARPVWLDFLDHQYGPPPAHRELVRAVEQAIENADAVASPLGLFHEDHLMTAAACFEVARRARDKRWFVYEDAIYRARPDASAGALASLRNDGLVLADLSFPEALEKRNAIQCYPSQVRGLADLLEDAYRPERYWELTSR